MSDFPLEAYLSRIGWTGPVGATPEMLIALHRRHTFTFPFENLDPFSGIPVSLDPSALVEKMIHRGRGGYCFEQNGLILLALQSIGFHTRSLMARVQISEGNYSIRSHQITLVNFDGVQWIADVGFGGNGLIEAIPFELECEFDQHLDRYRILADETYGYRLEHKLPSRWRTLYAFPLDPYLPADYAAINYFICRSPDSMFVKTPICVCTTPTERRLIVANQLKIRTSAGTTLASTLETSAQFRAALAGHLGISLPDDFPLPAPPAPPPGLRDV
jgi:N-hydroxyarylamine O-acetyltransferase